MAAAAAPGAALKIVSYNCNGIRAMLKKVNGASTTGALAKLLKGEVTPALPSDVDVFCFQETKLGLDPAPKDFQLEDLRVPGWEGFWHWSRGGKGGYSGVATYVRTSRVSVVGARQWGAPGGNGGFDEGRVVVVDLGAFLLYNVYAPNAGRDIEPGRKRKVAFQKALRAELEAVRAEGRQYMLLGDFNVCPTALDMHSWEKNAVKDSVSCFLKEEIGFYREMCKLPSNPAQGNTPVPGNPPPLWVDVFRHLHPDEQEGGYTWWDQRKGDASKKESAFNKNLGWRLDFCFVSPGLIDAGGGGALSQVQMSRLKEWGPDHCPIVVEAQVAGGWPEPGLVKDRDAATQACMVQAGERGGSGKKQKSLMDMLGGEGGEKQAAPPPKKKAKR